MASEPGAGLNRRVAQLAAAMRRAGVAVGLSQLLVAHSALAVIDAADRGQAYHALRAVMCSSRSDYESFDEAFRQTFEAPAAGARNESTVLQPHAASPVPAASAEAAEGSPAALRSAGWSDIERVRRTDFAALESDDLALVATLMADLARRGPQRRSRRLRAAHGGARSQRARVDVRATMRSSMRLGGEPVRRRWRRRTTRPGRLVVLCDVSGSMRPYSEGLLLFVHALVATRRGVEAFVFGTHLTRVTLELSGRDPRQALAQLDAAVSDWAGGTRIGESLRTLNREHGGRVGRGATVIVLSDGWDRGATDELAQEIARLHRTARQLVWLNPLKAAPGYEPLAKGMAAVMPHLDAFLAGNSVAGLEELADLLAAGLDARRHDAGLR